MGDPITLADFSKLETDPLRKSVIDQFRMESVLMDMVKFETIGALGITIIRYKELPSVAFRKIGNPFPTSKGKTEKRTEVIAAMGGTIDVDKTLVKANNTVAKVRAVQQSMMLKAMSYNFNDKFINGDRLVNEDEFQGIKSRIDALNDAGFTSQYIDCGLGTDEGILHDDDSMHTFLDKLDGLIYSFDGHNPDGLLMNSSVLLAVRSLLRRLKLLDTSKDQFGRIIDMYGKVPLLDVGTKADQITHIIPNTETLGGNASGSSIYGYKFGIGTHLWGIQEYPMDVTDKGELEDGVTYRTVVDWPLGLAIVNPRAVGRLYGVIPTNAAGT